MKDVADLLPSPTRGRGVGGEGGAEKKDITQRLPSPCPSPASGESVARGAKPKSEAKGEGDEKVAYVKIEPLII